MVYKFFDKETSSGCIENENARPAISEQLHKPIIRKF